MPRRTAIVLHGPMGVGKSTIAKELCRRLGTQAHVNLDDYFEASDPRKCPPAQRYAQLQSESDHLVVELGCAEPVDLAVPGATRGADEWYKRLVQDGRDVRLFRLTAAWQTIENRMKGRRSSELLSARIWHCAYANELDIVTLPTTLREQEVVVSVDGKSVQEIVDEILQQLDLL